MPSSNQVALDRIHPHPDNPRRDAESVETLAASIKAQGVLQAITIAPHPSGADDTWIVIDGHRRYAAAKQLGLDDLPCVLREDLTDPADQIGAMLATAREREPLSAAEEAAGVQAMLDLGESVANIAARTGMSKTKVRQRVKVAGLPEELREKIHTHAVTLADAEFIANHPDYRDDLEAALGTANWEMEKERVTIRAANAVRVAKQTKEAKSLGVRQIPSVGGGYRQVAEEHGVDEVRVQFRMNRTWDAQAYEALTDEERELAYILVGKGAPNVTLVQYRINPEKPAAETSTPTADHDSDAPAPDRSRDGGSSDDVDHEETVRRREAAELEREAVYAATQVRRRFVTEAPDTVREKAVGRMLTFGDPDDGWWIDFGKLDTFQDIDYDDFPAAIDDWLTNVSPLTFTWTAAIGRAFDNADIWFTRGPKGAPGIGLLAAREAARYADLLRDMGYTFSTIEQAMLDAFNVTILAATAAGDDE
ncbi:ParB/RepB/Spo0J family partition protein [Gordonia sihwensis]|uniref:ParB/RepB/Spo0J family partition protein n=1 Tax=Gordonia sihwensis TaxID=173559 RepID=UPI0024164DD1|nr:ParB/RepB/Spo0J family partition protein [Gordonia sihwensis]WFN93443.1 ParB/RepB/Spo0J family partition protein [Gordonia sihwensis]